MEWDLLEEGSAWLIGVGMSITGNTFINFGTNLLKYSHLDRSELSSPDRGRPMVHSSGSYDLVDDTSSQCSGSSSRIGRIRHDLQRYLKTRSPDSIWYAGFGLFAIGSILNFVSFGFATQSLLACLGSIQFITNVAFSNIVFGTKISSAIIKATVCIVFGNIIIVIFSQQHTKKRSGSEILNLFQEIDFVIFISIVSALSIAAHIAYLSLRKCYANNPIDGTKNLAAVFFSLSSGMIGAQSVVLAKCCSELLRSSFSGMNPFSHGITYSVIAGWIVVTIFWLRRMNKALELFDGVFIIPMLQVIWIVFSVLGGGIFFQEFQSYTYINAILFVVGISIILVGVFLLTSEATSDPEMRQSSIPNLTLDIDLSIGEFDSISLPPFTSPKGELELSEVL